MQRSGQTAKTQKLRQIPWKPTALTSAKLREKQNAPMRKTPSGQRLIKPGGGGGCELGRRGSPSPRRPRRRHPRGSNRGRHPQRLRAAGVTQRHRDLAGNFGVFLGERDVPPASHTHARPPPPHTPAPAAGYRPRLAWRHPGTPRRERKRKGPRLREATPAKPPDGGRGEGVPNPATPQRKLRRRPSPVPGGRGGGGTPGGNRPLPPDPTTRPGVGVARGSREGERDVEGVAARAAVFLPATPTAPASAPRSACGSPDRRPRPAPTRTTRRRRCCCTGTWP